MSAKHALKAFRCWARAASFRFRKRTLAVTSYPSLASGLESAAWTLVGITLSLLLSWRGIVMRGSFMLSSAFGNNTSPRYLELAPSSLGERGFPGLGRETGATRPNKGQASR